MPNLRGNPQGLILHRGASASTLQGDHTVQLATAVLSEVDHEEETEPEVLTHVNRSHGGEPKELGGNINDSNAWQRILCCESIEKLDQDFWNYCQ